MVGEGGTNNSTLVLVIVLLQVLALVLVLVLVMVLGGVAENWLVREVLIIVPYYNY